MRIANTPQRVQQLLHMNAARAECTRAFQQWQEVRGKHLATAEAAEAFARPVRDLEAEVYATLNAQRLHTHAAAAAIVRAKFGYKDVLGAWGWAFIDKPHVHERACAVHLRARRGVLEDLGWRGVAFKDRKPGDLVLYESHVAVLYDLDYAESKFGSAGPVMLHAIESVPPWYGDTYVILSRE